MGRDFHAVSAHLHAAPAASVIFGCVVEIEDAGGISAFFDQGKVSPTEQVACGFRERDEEIVHGSRHRVELLFKPAFPSDELRIPRALRQELVDGIDA